MNKKLFQRLCETPGVPGREERVREVVKGAIRGLFDEVREDAMGSLICTRKRTSGNKRTPTRILICAHMDEIGFYVRHVDEQGYAWVNPAGGFDPRNLFHRRVMVCTDKGDHIGVMTAGGKPVHISTPEERKQIPEPLGFYVDLGMDAEKARKAVQVGDYVVMHEPFVEQPEAFMSKAIDNRFAVFCAIEAVKKLSKGKGHACEIVVAFTTQEEVGLRGAFTAAEAVHADLGIGLDVTLCADTPGVPEADRVTKRGDGAGVMFMDSSMIADRSLAEDICRVAKRRKIPYQRCILPRGGQDGAAIQRSRHGVRCAAVVCGTRYVHTITESIHKGDLQATIDLLAAWIGSVK
ncbi:MAG: M20/M25/M40 family metallo-hydrolase [Phycisphaerales bacterium]|jgi:endoglucanase|nr:M20/M25/M40 family metallo-hydrolase [Phycisphaerales bacterium]